MRRPVLAVLCLTGCLLALVTRTPAADPMLPLVFSDDFANGAGRWEPTDANAWKVIPGDKGKVYSLFQQSKYKPPYRSPLNFSLVKDLYVSDFVLEARVKSTVRDYPHRDMCLFFGYQDPAHFYYAHLAKKTDDHANQIFIVDDKPREKISTKTTPGTDWDDKWHTVKVVRSVADGKIEIYLDDLKTSVMTATDKHFTWGRFGLGSFDDLGDWADVKLWGVKVEKKDRAGK
jgi:hypothetical protein